MIISWRKAMDTLGMERVGFYEVVKARKIQRTPREFWLSAKQPTFFLDSIHAYQAQKIVTRESGDSIP